MRGPENERGHRAGERVSAWPEPRDGFRRSRHSAGSCSLDRASPAPPTDSTSLISSSSASCRHRSRCRTTARAYGDRGPPALFVRIPPPTALLHWRRVAVGGEGGGMRSRRSRPVPAVPSSAFDGFRFPPEIIVLAVRWYLRYGLSYRDVEELLAERGIEVDHVTIYRWVQRFTPLLADAAGPCRHAVGDRWFVDETYVKVAGTVAVRLPGRRPARPDHRRVRLGQARLPGGAPVLRHGAPRAWRASRGRDRPGSGVAGCDRRADAGRVSQHRAVREQPRRMRPRPTQSPAPPDARPQTRPHRPSDHARPRADAEHPPRPLRTRHRRAPHRRVETAFTELARTI